MGVINPFPITLKPLDGKLRKILQEIIKWDWFNNEAVCTCYSGKMEANASIWDQYNAWSKQGKVALKTII